MLTCKRIVLLSIASVLSCSAANAQFKVQRVAEFADPNKGPRLVSGGREAEFADDKSKIITAFYGSTVQLFNLEKNVSIGEPIRTAGDGEVGFVNNEIAYTADWESLRLWNTQSGQQIGDAIPHVLREDTIIHPAISPQAKFIATRATMKSVQLWDVATRKPIGEPRKYSNEVNSIQFTDNGGYLIVMAGGSLYAIDSDTGDDAAGPIASGWPFHHFSKQHKLVTTEQIREGLDQLVIRATDQKGWPETHRSDLPGKLGRIFSLENNQILLQVSKKDFTPTMYIISLDKPATRIEVESNADRAFDVVVTPDKRHWICSNIEDIRCQKFGESEPVWKKQVPISGYDQHLYPFDNEHFIILDKEENFGVYKVADGNKVWDQTGVKRLGVTNDKIVLCKSEGVEVWVLIAP